SVAAYATRSASTWWSSMALPPAVISRARATQASVSARAASAMARAPARVGSVECLLMVRRVFALTRRSKGHGAPRRSGGPGDGRAGIVERYERPRDRIVRGPAVHRADMGQRG